MTISSSSLSPNPSTRVSYYSLHPSMPLQTTTLAEVQRPPSAVAVSVSTSPSSELVQHSDMGGEHDLNQVHHHQSQAAQQPCCRCSVMEPPPPPQSQHALLQTDILSVKASEIDQQHWHLLNLHLGSKRECAYCKKKGIIIYKGELFTRTGTVEMNSCARCGRTFGQSPKAIIAQQEKKKKTDFVVATRNKRQNWFTKFNY